MTGPTRARITRIITDESGGTAFAEEDVPLEATDFAPPSPPMLVSAPVAARAVRFLGAATGWDSPPHPAPARQYIVVLQGSVRGTVTSGEARTFGPGEVVRLEDTAGEGHRTFVPEGDDWLALVVVLD